MTMDGSGDHLIKIQGVDSYHFTDADGGPAGQESEDEGDDPEEREEMSADVEMASSDEEGVEADPDDVVCAHHMCPCTPHESMSMISPHLIFAI